jgi:hypothetical protein
MDVFFISLPAFLFCALSALPLAVGMFLAFRHWRAGKLSAYLGHLIAGSVAGCVALGLLWSSLFGDSLSKSSTAGLIFAIAPFYAVIAQGIVFGLAKAVSRKSTGAAPISAVALGAMLLPLAVFAVLMVGLIKTTINGNDSAVAQRASNPATLQRLLEKSQHGEADAFAVPLYLAQNPNTPPGMLTELARHDHPAVRGHVANHPQTPQAVLAALRNDCASFVRKAAVQRVGPNAAPLAEAERTGTCALERWR